MRIEQSARPPLVRPRAGFYYGPEGGTGQVAPANNTMHCVPFYLARRFAVDRIGVEVTAAGEAGSVVRLGIYADSAAESLPGALLLDAGTAPGDGATGFKTITIAQEIGPGLVWLALVCQSAVTTRPTLRSLAAAHYSGLVGAPAGLFAIPASNNAYTQSGVTGALPATFAYSSVGVGFAVGLRFV